MIFFRKLEDVIQELIKLMNAEPNIRFTVTKVFERTEWRIYTEREWVAGGPPDSYNDEFVIMNLNLDEIGKIYSELGVDLKLREKHASVQKDI